LQDEDKLTFESDNRRSQLNFSESFLEGLTKRLKLEGAERNTLPGISPELVIYYIYALLHSPTYRSRYSDHLSIDFPRIPLPRDLPVFDDLTRIGHRLVELHLLHAPNVGDETITLTADDDLLVEKVSYSNKTVWINSSQTVGFGGISEEVWAFSIGGNQVCQKWLKDRQAKGGQRPRPGRVLTVEDVAHYKKMVLSIAETIRLMDQADDVIETHGGWPGAFTPSSDGG
jgi:predicted helicase